MEIHFCTEFIIEHLAFMHIYRLHQKVKMCYQKFEKTPTL